MDYSWCVAARTALTPIVIGFPCPSCLLCLHCSTGQDGYDALSCCLPFNCYQLDDLRHPYILKSTGALQRAHRCLLHITGQLP
jgi:hypothetical protein